MGQSTTQSSSVTVQISSEESARLQKAIDGVLELAEDIEGIEVISSEAKKKINLLKKTDYDSS